MTSQRLSGDKKVTFPELSEFAGRVLQRYGLELRPTSRSGGPVMAGKEHVGFLSFYGTHYYPEADSRAELQVYSGLPKSQEYYWSRIAREINQEWPKSQ